ncbi:hypothetical protein WN093_12210 [Gammaproteobacteria bacterium AS21]
MAKYKETLLNEFEARDDDWSFGDFDRRISELKKDANYQDSKMAIIEAHKVGGWPNTIKRYLLTNYRSFGNVNIELHTVFNSMCDSLTDEEKAHWGINI